MKCPICGVNMKKYKANFIYEGDNQCSHWERELTKEEITLLN